MNKTHYAPERLADTIDAALAGKFAPDHRLDVADLARLDQFHTRGLAATIDLAKSAGVAVEDRVLDIGAGLGGPARYLASTYGCWVVGIDSSAPFVTAARLLTDRSGLASRVTFVEGDALTLPFDDASFDVIWMQHVAMNVEDRAGLYTEFRRVLKSGGRFATYDVLLKDGAPTYPMPWASNEAASFLRTEDETRELLRSVGFREIAWREESDIALAWFERTAAAAAPSDGFDLTLAMGPNFPAAVANLRRNLAAGTIGILSAVLVRE